MPRPVALVEKNGSKTWASYPGGNPVTLIVNADLRVIVAGRSGPHGHDAIAAAQLGDGVDGVDDDVEDGLLEQHAIAVDRRPVAVEFQRQPDAADQGVARKQHGDITHDILRSSGAICTATAPPCRAPAGSHRGATAILHDVVEPLGKVGAGDEFVPIRRCAACALAMMAANG